MSQKLFKELQKLENPLLCFGLDDTMLHTEHLSHLASKFVLEQANPGIELPSDYIFYQYLAGYRVADHYSQIAEMLFDEGLQDVVLFPDDFAELRDAKQEEYFANLTPFEGLENFLQLLEHEGVNFVIVSNSGEKPLLQKLKASGLSSYFEGENRIFHPNASFSNECYLSITKSCNLYGINLNHACKTKIAMLLAASFYHNTPTKNMLLLDDSPSALISAKEIGVTPVGFVGAKEGDILTQLCKELKSYDIDYIGGYLRYI